MTPLGSHGAPVSNAIDETVQSLAAGLAGADWQVTPGQADDPWRFVARTSEFRLRWMGVRLHTFVFVVPLRGGEDVAWLDAQLRAAVQHSRANRGGLPEGLQSGSAVVMVSVGSGLSPEVRTWAGRAHGQQLATVTHPVLVDLATGDVLEPARPAIGAIYHGYLRGVVARFVRASARA
ncbi:hypothetical protein [Cellulomonas sp. KRMCY2]|uniref:hypothetical protein n=1 Tax=Cellulomonas sp. KRMCY2 TaxID=1304865 RepID=UPI00045EA4E3|nr:hypothetical protein [Cellulomonas sp. KRMCY2]